MNSVTSQLRSSRTAVSVVFANRALRRIFVAYTGSKVGDEALNLAVAVYVFTVGGTIALGILAIVRYVAVAVASPFASMLADRFDQKLVMIYAHVVQALILAVVAALIWTHSSAWLTESLIILVWLTATAFWPAQQAILPLLALRPSELTGANVLASTIENVGVLVGPAIAGVLLKFTNVPVAFLFNSAALLGSAIIVMGIRRPDPSEANASTESERARVYSVERSVTASLLSSSIRGFREILFTPDIRLVVGLYCLQCIVGGAAVIFSVSIALHYLRLGSSGLGLLQSFMGIGGLIGGFLSLMLVQRSRLATDFGLGVILWATPCLLFAAMPEFGMAAVMMSLIGVANSVVDVNAITIMQRVIPSALLARTFGAMEACLVGSMAFGSLLMAVLIRTIGLRPGLAILGGVITIAVLPSLPSLGRMDRDFLAPAGSELLRHVPILAALPQSVIERLTNSSVMMEFPQGSTVFSEGDPGDLFYVIEDGTAEITIRGQHIRNLSTGDSFGEIALLRDIPRTATVTARSPLVLRAIESQPFVAAVTSHRNSRSAANQVVANLLRNR